MQQKTFIGTKAVLATAMTRIEYSEYRGWKLPEDEELIALEEGFLTEDLSEPSNDARHAGYISWLPKRAFESSYQDINKSMTFGHAVELMKKGFKVARKGWNGSGMFTYYVPANSYPAERGANMEGVFPNDMVPYREYLALKTAQGDVATWAPSCSDSLAEDWVTVD